MRGGSAWRVIAGAVLLAGLAAPAAAQGLHTTAIRLDLGSKKTIVAFEISNPGTRDTLVHIRPFAWTQEGGEDRLMPTERVVVNPPIFELRPQERQLVRVGLVGPAAGAEEQAFRLLVDEVPDHTIPSAGQVRTTVRLSLPVFVAAAAAPAPRLEVGRPLPAGLPLRNAGNAHIRIDQLSLRDAGGAELARRKLFLYLLPGAEMVVPIALARGGEPRVALVAMETNAGPLTIAPR